MTLPEFSIRRPVAASVMVCALVVFGFIGLRRLGVSLYPDVDYPIVKVSTLWPNARPEEVDNEVTDRLEDAVSAVGGIRRISSQSLSGRSQITIEFQLDKNVDLAAWAVAALGTTRGMILGHLLLPPSSSPRPVISVKESGGGEDQVRRPLSQALQEYPEQRASYARVHRRSGAKLPGHTVQMWARLGCGPQVQPAPRRGVPAYVAKG